MSETVAEKLSVRSGLYKVLHMDHDQIDLRTNKPHIFSDYLSFIKDNLKVYLVKDINELLADNDWSINDPELACILGNYVKALTINLKKRVEDLVIPENLVLIKSYF